MAALRVADRSEEQVLALAALGVDNVDVREPKRMSPSEALHRVAITVNASLDIKETIERLLRVTLEAIPADRCALLLVDAANGTLAPALSIGQVSDAELWQRFRDLPPIDLATVPERWHLFAQGRALSIADMAESPLIPPGVVEVFGSRSAILAPLIAREEPIGLLVLDWRDEVGDKPEEDVLLLEAIAAYASLAIRNARLYDSLASKARSLERLVEVAGAINSSPSLPSVLDLVCSAFEQLLGSTHCSLNLLDAGDPPRVETVSVRGEAWFAGNRDVLAAAPPAELSRVANLWGSRPEPVIYPDLATSGFVAPELLPASVRSIALFPLVQRGRVLGAVVAGFAHPEGPKRQQLEAAQALAELAAASISRATVDRALRLRLRQVETLSTLSDVVATTTELDSALDALNRMSASELGVRFSSISVSNRSTRSVLSATAPSGAEADALRTWRRAARSGGRQLEVIHDGDDLLIPVARRGELVGVLRGVPAALDAREAYDEGVLLAIGAACADVLHKAVLHAELAENERSLAVAGERERIARDLHDSVAQLLLGMAMRVTGYVADAPDHDWRERMQELLVLAKQGTDDVRGAISALLFLQVGRDGLAQSLAELAHKFEASSDFAVPLHITGDPTHVPQPMADAVFRVAHEALVNAQRHSRASLVNITLDCEATRAHLTVRDDGVGLGNRDPFGHRPGHFGVRGMRELIEAVGGKLTISPAHPRGVAVEALVEWEVCRDAGRRR
jgi:signal transduction histidine kinase